MPKKVTKQKPKSYEVDHYLEQLQATLKRSGGLKQVILDMEMAAENLIYIAEENLEAEARKARPNQARLASRRAARDLARSRHDDVMAIFEVAKRRADLRRRVGKGGRRG